MGYSKYGFNNNNGYLVKYICSVLHIARMVSVKRGNMGKECEALYRIMFHVDGGMKSRRLTKEMKMNMEQKTNDIGCNDESCHDACFEG